MVPSKYSTKGEERCWEKHTIKQKYICNCYHKQETSVTWSISKSIISSPRRKITKVYRKDTAQTFSLIQWETERKVLSKVFGKLPKSGFYSCRWKDLEAPRNTARDSILAQPLETASGTAQEIEEEYLLVQQFHFWLIH